MKIEPGILQDIEGERERQETKWGEQNHAPELWQVILLEEIGEAAKALLEGDAPGYRAEMIQAAAVTIAAIGSLDRWIEFQGGYTSNLRWARACRKVGDGPPFSSVAEALSIIYTALALHSGQTLTTYGEGTENVGQPAPPAEPESDAVSRAKDDILCEEEGKK